MIREEHYAIAIILLIFFAGYFTASAIIEGKPEAENRALQQQIYRLQTEAIRFGYAYTLKNGNFVWVERKAEK